MAKTRKLPRAVDRQHAKSAFTLIEVVIAVVILASALVTILGLQSAIMQRTLRDEGRQQAMLLARSILAAVESNIETIEVQDHTLPAKDLVTKLLGSVPEKQDPEEPPLFEFMARFTVGLWGIPHYRDDAMKRIRLSIFSPQQPEDSFDVVFFISNEQ